MRTSIKRAAGLAAATIIASMALAVPASPASAHHLLAEITGFSCDTANRRFFCEVQGVVYAGYFTRPEWWINNSKVNAYNHHYFITQTCSVNAMVTVRVALWSYYDLCWCERDHRMTSFRCRDVAQ